MAAHQTSFPRVWIGELSPPELEAYGLHLLHQPQEWKKKMERKRSLEKYVSVFLQRLQRLKTVQDATHQSHQSPCIFFAQWLNVSRPPMETFAIWGSPDFKRSVLAEGDVTARDGRQALFSLEPANWRFSTHRLRDTLGTSGQYVGNRKQSSWSFPSVPPPHVSALLRTTTNVLLHQPSLWFGVMLFVFLFFVLN